MAKNRQECSDAFVGHSAGSRPIVFLDLDDVLCLNAPFGGFDALLAIGREQGTSDSDLAVRHQDLWVRLFDAKAIDLLRAVHAEFEPAYVMSTSWTRFMDRDLLAQVLRLGGAAFVAENFHEDWETLKLSGATRADEIEAWLAAHPHMRDSWVVLDDVLSGSGLDSGSRNVVLCREGAGFTDCEQESVRQALVARLVPR